MARNPKKIWNEIKVHKEEVTGTFSEEDLLMYVKKFYSIPKAKEIGTAVPSSIEVDDCFTVEDVEKAVAKMHNGKACDTSGIHAEMLKWLPQEGLTFVTDILNQAYHNGFPLDWQDNCIKALHKGGDRNELSNYRTIMIGPITAKLFGSLLEQKLNAWAQIKGKRARGQAGFKTQHSTTDHLITL